MTISSTNSRIIQTSDGVQTTFTYDFYIAQASDLKVYLDGVLQSSGLYSVTGVGNPAGGTVVFTSAPAAGSLSLNREVPLNQLTDYLEYGAFPASSHETALDKLTMIAQQITTDILSSIRVGVSEDPSTLTLTLPDVSGRANKYLSFDASGNISLVPSSSSDPNSVQKPSPSASADQLMAFDSLNNAKDSGYSASSLLAAALSAAQAEDATTSAGDRAYTDTEVANAKGIKQVVRGEQNSVLTTSASIPHDDSIPQNTEGYEVLAVTITPTNATHNLLIEVEMPFADNATGENVVGALFQDSNANALRAQQVNSDQANSPAVLRFSHFMQAGTTSATTFKLRVGGKGGQITINGDSTVRRFGGVMGTSITITEIRP